ncbi:TPA: YSIRK-type signal peptide-containing protein [Streptococcus pneumoniae]|nr:YSIRK-type signal peptide-containing protein [Streptococcus pneumoniae]MDG9649208.1 YSIRK-type signal peptide-containing protein [Streptococcus pneumoniae]VQD95618.1 collagen-like surface-anchored protein [Streptococcus pneumoniae]VQE04494.1 collagen-like surface-anchored protein [Streptococcus pneumoniae]VRQ86763.1 collagen-like surface-anchored protein [Streptococcus pneumoniae]
MKHSHKKSFDWYSMQQRYSIRKYYFGAVSVLLGTALVLGAAASVQTVQAEENKQETTNSISVGRGEAATKPAEVSASNKEKTYAAPTVANPVETTPVKTGEVTKPAEKVEEAKDKKEEVTHQDAIDKSKLLTALSRAKKLESKLYTEASAANLQTSIQAGQSLLGKADASEAELSAAESSIQSSIIGLELRSNSNKGTVSETPVAKKANIVEAKEETNPAATTDRSAVDSAVLPTSTAAKVETTSAPASINEILKPGLSLSDARQNPAIRKEDVDRGYSGFRTAGSGFRAAGPENKPILNPNNTIAFSDISQGSHSFRGIGHSRGGQEIHYDVTTVRSGNSVNFTISYSAPGDSREFVNNNFILDKGTGYGNPSSATVSNRYTTQTRTVGKGANFVSHSGYSMNSAVETNVAQTIRFSLPITNPNGDLSLRLRPVAFNVDQGGGGSATSNDPYSNSNYYYETDPLYLDANPAQPNPSTASFKSKVDFQTLYIPTTKLAEGVTELVSEGVEGEKSQAYRLHKFGDQYVLGLPVGNATTVTAAKPRVMKYGIGKIAVTQNKTGDTNHIKFYLDKDGDGVFNNQDEVILNTDIKDGERGPTGATGAQGPAGPKGADGQRGPAGPQGPKGEQGNPGTPGKDGKSLIAVKNGTETKVYVEDPARPGQPLNPNQPLATITDGRNGTNGQSPTITATRSVQNGKNGVLVTITPVGGRPQTTFVEDGQKGADRKTPTVTITEGQNGTHTLTVHNPGSPDVTTTIRDGATGQAGRDGKDVLNGKVNPQPNQGKNGDKYINTETGDVYVKNNGNWDKEGNIKGPKGDKGADGAKGEKGDQGERGLTGAQGAKGADGAVGRDGRDGKDVLNGKANPEAHQGKDGDKYVNTETGDVFVKNNGNWDKEGNIKGPKGDKGADGAKGEKGDQGERGLTGAQGAKGADGRDGKSLLTVKDGKETKVYQEDLANPGQPLNPEKPLAVIRDGVDGKSPTVTAVRKDEAGHKGVEITVDNHDGSQPTTVFVQDGAKGETGATGQDGQTPTITTQRGQDGQSTVVTITTPGKDPVTFTVKDGKNGKDGRAPKIKVEDITSPSRIRRATDAAATPTRNGIRVTVYDDVNDNGVYDEGVDKVLNSKDIYNGIDGRDGSAPTITTKDNGDGTHTITVQNPDGSESTTVVKDGKDGKTANITTTENPDGSHTITVTNPDGSTKETVVKNGKDGKTPKVEVTDNNDGTHTVKVTDGDGNVTNAIIKDGKDGKAATATTTENPDGSHTVTITNPDGTKNEFVVKNGRDGVDGRTPTASVRDNGDGSHTIVITNPEGVTTETTVRDGKSPKVTITDEQNGTHKISVLNGDGTTTETIIKDGKSPVATVRDNQDGTYTIRVENGNGTVSETTVRDGKSPTAKVVDNGDGTHTITVVNSDGTTTTTTVRDGREPKLEVIDNNDGSHTIKVTGADGKGTTTTIFDGKSPKANIVDNGDGTHTLTIVDSDGREYKSIIKDGKDGKDSVSPTVTVKNNNDGTHVVTITNPDGSKTEMVIKDGKDGKSPKVSVEDNGDGSHTITIINSDGTVTKTVIKDGKDGRDGRDGRDGKDGKDGKCGCQDKPVTPSNDKPVPPTPNVPTPEVPVKPVPAQPTPNVPTPEVPVQPTPAVSTPEVPVKPVPAVPEQPVVPTPAQPATPVNANPVAPTTGKENRGDKLPETGSQSDYISVLLGSGILLSLYVGRRKED